MVIAFSWLIEIGLGPRKIELKSFFIIIFISVLLLRENYWILEIRIISSQ